MASACAGKQAPTAPVHHRGGERLLDLGEVDFVLDPTTDARFIRIEDRKRDRQLTFHEKDAEGGWARIEIHRFAIDSARAAALRADPQQLKGHYLPDVPIDAADAAGLRVWAAETSLPYGTRHEWDPGGRRSTVEDPSRYQWMAAIITPAAVLVIIYVGELTHRGDRDLPLDEILRQGRIRHGARAATILGRLRASVGGIN